MNTKNDVELWEIISSLAKQSVDLNKRMGLMIEMVKATNKRLDAVWDCLVALHPEIDTAENGLASRAGSEVTDALARLA